MNRRSFIATTVASVAAVTVGATKEKIKRVRRVVEGHEVKTIPGPKQNEINENNIKDHTKALVLKNSLMKKL